MKNSGSNALVWLLVILIIVWVIANPGPVAHILSNLSQIRP
jgi:hypothetical protein